MRRLSAAHYGQVGGDFFQQDRVGNQYLFFIGDSVLAGTGLKDPGLRYSAQIVRRFKKYFPEASMPEIRKEPL